MVCEAGGSPGPAVDEYFVGLPSGGKGRCADVQDLHYTGYGPSAVICSRLQINVYAEACLSTAAFPLRAF